MAQQITVNRLALALGETTDLERVYQTIYQYIKTLVDTWAFIVSSYNDTDQLIRAEFVIYEGVELDVSDFPPIPLGVAGQGTQSRVIHTGELLYTPHYQEAAATAKREYIVEKDGTINEGPPPEEEKENSTQSALYVPIKIEGKVVGVMQLQSCQPDAYTPEDIDLLAALVDEVLDKLPPPERIRVKTEISATVTTIFVDPGQIEQVLTNLVTNAFQAMPDGGILKLGAKNDNHQIVLTVTDTGCGIPPENISRLFEPLFTTKSRGVGLGLVTSKNLVEGNDGSIAVESEIGLGSTFTVRLLTINGKSYVDKEASKEKR